MDHAFMEHYFNSVYEDIVTVLTADNSEYETAKSKFCALQKDLLEKCGDINNPIWQQHETVIAANHRIQAILLKLAYLKGAEDRERMLR